MILWLIYLGLTVMETIMLMFGGMDLFTALCHTFGTLATGGFSTLNASVAGFDSLYIEMVILAFMFLAGTNFALHFFVIQGRLGEVIKNREWQFYVSILVIAIFPNQFPVWTGFGEYQKPNGEIDRAKRMNAVGSKPCAIAA